MRGPKKSEKPSRPSAKSPKANSPKPAAKIQSPKAKYQSQDASSHKPTAKSQSPNYRGTKKTKAPGDPLPKMDALDQRLNKYLSNAGICSRREADVLIQSGAISVNGVIVTELGFKIKPGDKVQYDGDTVHTDKKRYILVNKPKEFVVTADDTWGRKSIYDLIRKKVKETIYPVGQLDRDATGLMFYTNDGDLFKKLVHPAKMAVSLFHVTLNKPFNPEKLEDLSKGKWDLGNRARVLNAEIVPEKKNFELGVEIKTDNGNAIRKIFEKHGYEVMKLDRVTFAGLSKKDLPRGFFRDVTEQELSFLRMY